MRYFALAVDYDGTLAHDGKVDDATVAALKRFRESGRRLVMVTGRVMPELMATFGHVDLFDRIVAENGALIYDPATKEEKTLAETPKPEFLESLKKQGVGPVSMGKVIVATWEPHEKTVLKTIHDMGLELQIIFNKGAVMVLPSGVNKATGLAAALKMLGLSPHNCVGAGDAENDHAMLSYCECGVAVANALPAVKERADLVTEADHGAGVAELIDRVLADDLASLEPRLQRHRIVLGQTDDGTTIDLEPHGFNILVAGSSGSGKSTLTMGILERLGEKGYQYLIIDPEGDYSTVENATVVGDSHRAPSVDEVIDRLKKPRGPIVVNLLGVPLEDRPAFADALMPRLQASRARTGRPHWIVVDEAHHLMHAAYAPADHALPRDLRGMLFITVHPESLARGLVESIDLLVAVGDSPAKAFEGLCKVGECRVPPIRREPLASGEALVWRPRGTEPPVRVKTSPPKMERRRHLRKYAEGNLGPERSFYFRGPDNKLNLKAHNLTVFQQLADGIDDETWAHHLAKGDYSTWFRDYIKDSTLAEDVAKVESGNLTPAESRAAIKALIAKRYTLSADRPSGIVGAKEKNGNGTSAKPPEPAAPARTKES